MGGIAYINTIHPDLQESKSKVPYLSDAYPHGTKAINNYSEYLQAVNNRTIFYQKWELSEQDYSLCVNDQGIIFLEKVQ